MEDAEFRSRFGPWALVAGASEGVGAAFAEELSERGLSVVLVARREGPLEEVAGRLVTPTRIVTLDLAEESAASRLDNATSDLDIGLVVYSAGSDLANTAFLETSDDVVEGLFARNGATALRVSRHFGRRLMARGRGGLVLVSSWASQAGAANIATYAATKAFQSILAESLWAEWKPTVDVLGVNLPTTDTPALRAALAAHGAEPGAMGDPRAYARETLLHLGDGPTWTVGHEPGDGALPLAGLPRRQLVELMSAGHAAMFSPPAT